MGTHGKLTAAIGAAISEEMKNKGFDVYYDHGKPGQFVGTIPISIEEELTAENQISQLDIVVVENKEVDNPKTITLVEIEETSNSPKTIIGDIFTTLMGKSIHLPGRKKTAKVGSWTTLIVLCKDLDEKDLRIMHFENMANKAISALGMGNLTIGKVVVKGFVGEADLKVKLFEQIEFAIQGNK